MWWAKVSTVIDGNMVSIHVTCPVHGNLHVSRLIHGQRAAAADACKREMEWLHHDCLPMTVTGVRD